MKFIIETVFIFITIALLAGCGGSECEALAEEICACENLPQEVCAAAESHAEDAAEDGSGMREEECGRVKSKFDCNIPDFIKSD